ncbi:hypothetical protein Voc01_061000 [Virgisporangium ochraceum]|uniref:Uncharacterized protein n=1 Tax=Virgisporangium ochraceum TaxID=65505 RepID=A0A8J3ZZQ2_9ACTN|nr:hypothetical protein Voc01_061000 [Virgisporangium ochraceum]
MWRRFLTVPAWVAVVLILGPSGGGPPAEAPTPPGATATRPVGPTAARLDALAVAITGTAEELRASERLNYHRVEGGVAACMAAAGRPYRMAPFVSFYADFTDADLGYGTGSATVFDSVTERGRRLVLNTIAGARLSRAGLTGRGWVGSTDIEALNRCRAPYEYRAYHDFDPPPGAYRLAGFVDLLETVLRDPRVTAAFERYRPCMRARLGHDVPDRSDFLFQARLPAGHAPLDGQPPDPEWTRGLRALDEAFALDVECRLPAYREAMRVVAANLDAWERRHRTELDAVRAAWRQRVADAATLGR